MKKRFNSYFNILIIFLIPAHGLFGMDGWLYSGTAPYVYELQTSSWHYVYVPEGGIILTDGEARVEKSWSSIVDQGADRVTGWAWAGYWPWIWSANEQTWYETSTQGGQFWDYNFTTHNFGLTTVLNHKNRSLVWVEAEAGTEVLPMVEINSSQASEGHYISNSTADQGMTTLDFSIESTNMYYLWVRKIAPNAGSNSFYMTIDSEPESTISLDLGSEWKWEAIGSISLSSGSHQLHLRGREVGTQIDVFCITDDPDYVPTTTTTTTTTPTPTDCGGPYGPAEDLPYEERFDLWPKGRYQSPGGTDTWSSGGIEIIGKQWVVFSVDYKQGGTNKFEAEDTLKIWYEINGGPPQYLVEVNGEFATGAISKGVCLEDVTIEVKFESITSNASEIHFVDNIRVEAPEIDAVITVPELPAYSTPPIPATPDASSGVLQYGTTPRYSASPYFDLQVNDVDILVDEKFEALECPVLDPTAIDYSVNIARMAFDFGVNATATIKVTASETINSYTISPQNPSAFGYGGTQFYTNVSTSGSTLTFEIKDPKNMLIKINDLPYLMVFVDPVEVNPPPSSGSNIINLSSYLDSGRNRNADVTEAFQEALDDASTQMKTLYVPDDLYMCGQLVVKSNTHLYLSSGAMVQSIPVYSRDLYPDQDSGDSSFIFIGNNSVTMENLESTKVSDVVIDGRGTIDGYGWRMRYYNDSSLNTANVKLLRMANAENVFIDGIYFRHSSRWSIQPILSNNIEIDNIKLINNVVGFFHEDRGFHFPYVSNTDGFDFDSSRNVTVDNAFIFTGDDSFTPKTTGYMGLLGECSDIRMTNNVMWSEKASLKIGSETNADIHTITFENNHIIRGDRILSVLSESADDINLYAVDILNTRTEIIGGNAKERFFRFRMTKTGSIHDFEINGIDALLDDVSFCSSEGLDGSNRITDIEVSNFKINNQVVDFEDVFKYLTKDDAYADYAYSVWTFNGIQFVGEEPVD